MTNADYADDLALLENVTAEPESQLNSREQIAGVNGLYVKSNKAG